MQLTPHVPSELLKFRPESSSIQEAVTSFINDPHRMELVLEHKGVRWINDSKTTNVDSVYWL